MSLPSGYTRLEYIRFTGTQYFDLGLKPGYATRVVCDVNAAPTTAAAWFFGARSGNESKTYNVLSYEGKYRSDYNNSTAEYSTVSPSGRFVIDKNQNVTSFGGTVGVTAAKAKFTCAYNLYLGANNNAGTAAGFGSFYLYSCQVYDSSVTADSLWRDLIPCKNASGTVGLWDEVDSKFYENAGTGTLVAGPEVVEPTAAGTHKTLIGGTAYSITGGRTLIGGTGYDITKGRTLVGGTGYDIAFAPAGTPLSSFTPGSVVKLNESGSPAEFYVAKHDYESSVNGTGRALLVRKDCCTSMVWNSSGTNQYGISTVFKWLTGTYKNMLDAGIQTAIALPSGRMAVPCTLGNGQNTAIWLYADVFLLSLTELGKTAGYANTEGTALDIASTLQIAKLDGSAINQWTRTPFTGDTSEVYYLLANGNASFNNCIGVYGIRPCLTLPDTILVDADNNVIV